MGNFSDTEIVIPKGSYSANLTYDFASMYPSTYSAEASDWFLEAKRQRRLEKLGLIDES